MSDVAIHLRDRRLHGCWLGRDVERDPYAPTLVFLHEGLGCVELWRGFPEALCARTGLRGFAYDRTGYGRSGPWPEPPGPRYLEIESDTILPQVLDSVGVGTCLLVGHSDGGTAALNYAACQPPMLRGVVTIGAHVVTEERTLSSVRQAREAFLTGDLRERLRKYHGDNVDGAFGLWCESWLSPGWGPMADARLPRVRVPVLALQGEHDEYATMVQLRAIARGVSGRCETRVIPECGHGPHLQDETTMVEAIARFITTLWRGPSPDSRRSTVTAGLLLACLLLGAGPARAQGEGCPAPAARAALGDAADGLQRMDEAAAAETLRAAWSDVQMCPELATALVAVDGWIEARRLAPLGGAPDRLGPINGLLRRLDEDRAALAATSVLGRLNLYAEAALRAAVAAAQDERDEMQAYLVHARDLATALAAAGQPMWPLPIDELEGELWLEADRFADARAAFARAASAGRGARGALGLARSLDRMGERAAACAAYERADALPSSDAARFETRGARARLGCGGP
ncbi:MAG: alpha/beta fold hydrolase [Vicinamibacterales bacterium]